jgi:hypothetical protein
MMQTLQMGTNIFKGHNNPISLAEYGSNIFFQNIHTIYYITTWGHNPGGHNVNTWTLPKTPECTKV